MLIQWISLSLFAPFVWAVGNIGDRYLCVRGVKNEYALAVMAALFRLPLFLIFWCASGWFVPEIGPMLLALVAGVCVILPGIFYLRALRHEESSRVMLLYYATSPVATFVLGSIFLGEKFDALDITGSVLLLLAGFFSIIKFQTGFFKFHTSVLWVLVGSVLWPISDVIAKYLTPAFPSTTSLLAWEALGGLFAVFLLLRFPECKRNCKLQNFNWPRVSWLIFVFNMVLFQIGLFAFFKALALERVALTVVLNATQPLMNFGLELVAQKFIPEIEKMDLGIRSLLPKGIAFGLMIMGIWLFTF